MFQFPSHIQTVGKKVEYLSQVLMPAKRFDDYIDGMRDVMSESVHYIDPVHEYRDRESALVMLRKYVPRSANDDFEFALISDTPTEVIWRWRISLKIRFTWFKFVIHGLVHARVVDGKVVYQREYYDPMESIGMIPIVGRLYKLVLQLG